MINCNRHEYHDHITLKFTEHKTDYDRLLAILAIKISSWTRLQLMKGLLLSLLIRMIDIELLLGDYALSYKLE